MLDPGKLTGWARLADGHVFSSGEEEFLETGHIIRSFCTGPGIRMLGWERFDITPHTYQMKGSEEAIQVTGMARYLAEFSGTILLRPMARQAKKQVPDGMLKALGWYRPGHGGHANDAARLMMAWLVSQRFLLASLQDKIATYLKEEASRN